MTLTIALDRYDRHLPIFKGAVRLGDGLPYRALEVGMAPPRDAGIDRHRRMLTDLEFDIAEVSLCSYIMAKARGTPLTAVPVFPRRLFSQNHVWVNKAAGIRTPADLAGKRVGVWAFQVTMSVLAKGDLKSEYGAPWEKMRWVTDAAEEIAWQGTGLSIERAPKGRSIADMLIDGELDAYIYPHPPYSIQTRTDRVERLFKDAKSEALRYFARRGYFPIMHLIAIKDERVRENPALPRLVMQMWEEAKHLSHDFYHDPGYSLLAFARNEYEEQAKAMGADPWPSGLTAKNRQNLQDFMGYMVDQRLIDAALSIDELFHESTVQA